MKYIQLVDVAKAYTFHNTQVIAIDKLNLEIEKGEFVCVMGESGSGKSTLLNILGGLTRIDNGNYVYRGSELVTRREVEEFRRSSVGFIVQHYALIEDRSVYENIVIPLRYKGYKTKAACGVVMKKLEDLGISELSERYPYQLSGGQRQKVAIARATIHDPDLLLADEPTGALDGNSENEVMKILDELHMSGKTIVLVTHDSHIAKQCSRICFLKNGRIVKSE